MRFRTYYDFRTPKTGIIFTEPSRTKQSELADSDINNIMSRYALTGVAPSPHRGKPLYGDFSDLEDYQASLNKVISAEERFNSLPVELRKKFDYNPQNMINFILDENNKEECIKYGFINENVVSSGDSNISSSVPPVSSSLEE